MGFQQHHFFAAKFPNENGHVLDINQYKDKILVVNFWASWCPPCRDEMPELSALSQQYKDKNVVVIGVAAEELATMRKFILDNPVTYNTIAGDIETMSLASLLGNSQGALPYTVIINTDGHVKNVYLGRISVPQLHKDLNALLHSKMSL